MTVPLIGRCAAGATERAELMAALGRKQTSVNS